MASSRLTWVYTRQDRAKDVPKDVIDKYKDIIRQLYLDRNMTCLEVIVHLKDNHKFNLTTSQFAKATKRWGFYKQPRQAKTKALEAAIVQEPEPLGAIFDIEVDASGADDENASLVHTVDTLVPDSHIPKNTDNEGASCKEPMPENEDTSPEDRNHHQRTRPSTGQCHTADVKTSTRISIAPRTQISSTSRCLPTFLTFRRQRTLRNHDAMPESSSDYLACCYLYQDSFDCIEENIRCIGDKDTAADNFIRQFLDLMRVSTTAMMGSYAIGLLETSRIFEVVERDADERSTFSYTSAQDRMLLHAYLSRIYALIEGLEDKVQLHLGRSRQIRDELVASPNCSLSIWSVLHLQQESSQRDNPGDFLARLDIEDGEFLHSFQMCLRLCKQCLQMVEKGDSSHALVQLDSLFLHPYDAAISQDISRLIQKKSCLDTWQEAGFLFAFVWGNAQQETSIPSSWWKQVDVSGMSTTHFLAVTCRMIIHQTIISHKDVWEDFGWSYVTKELICTLYLDKIEDFMTTGRSPKDIKRDFLKHFTMHHTWSRLEPADNRSIKRVQNYQWRVLDNVIRQRMESAKDDSSVKEASQAPPLQTDIRIADSFSLGSGKSNKLSLRSTSSSHDRQRYFSALSNNPTMTRSPASGSSRGSSMNSFRRFQAASTAMTIRLKDYHGSHMQSLDEQGTNT
ncbi:hypothetical protein Focb16_v008167 [Fusarium oxysporum f. sp. cubense]|uniref:Clr5 domain-containing protein n=1 Tax=Fusarium oxysporum f. sp. cubense TaxID=61366 RepID=A0A559LW60_FUSOC|nr:hypothetical protein Focb16_v008167 [Fusarium oxysporum f. sp. cubense]